MNISREVILEQLKLIVDPVTGRNIVEAGIVSHISIDDNNNIKFSLEIEEITFKKRQFLAAKCQDRLKNNIKNINQVLVAITNKPQIASKTIIVASGKGGVGKSTVALNIAIDIAQRGYSVAIVDADIYGPSIPHMLGIKEKPSIENGKVVPFEKYGVKSISMGYFIPDDKAVIWRGPMITKSLNQMITGTSWGKLDYMIIDTPPGTGDVHISLSKACKISSAIIVSTPQELSVIDAVKACDMFKTLNIKIHGLVVNMSHVVNSDNHIEYLFGNINTVDKILQQFSINCLAKIPFHQSISSLNEPAALNHSVKKYFIEVVNSIL